MIYLIPIAFLLILLAVTELEIGELRAQLRDARAQRDAVKR